MKECDVSDSGVVREKCPVCQFEWDVISPEEVSPRIRRAVGEFVDVLQQNRDISSLRPDTERWSIIEYAAHVRDVLLLVRDRLVLTVVEDRPTPSPLYRDERVRLNLYGSETVDSVSSDLEIAAKLFTTVFDVLCPENANRTLMYGYPKPAERSFAWTGAQVLHECEHHLDDVRQNATQLTK